MDSTHKTPILTEELRELLGKHTKVQAEINAEMGNVRPDDSVLSGLKKRKLAFKDKMQMLLRQLPPSQFAPVNPALYAKTDAELQQELLRRQRAYRRRADRVGQGAFELVALTSAVREVDLEIERRELEAMVASEVQLEMPLEVAA